MFAIISAGFLCGLIVSIPPGSNFALVVGRVATWKLILTIAAYDFAWAIIGATGVLAAQHILTTQQLALCSAIALLVTAWLIWPKEQQTVTQRRLPLLLVIFNLPAIAIWISINSSLSVHPNNALQIFLFAAAAAVGTALWFFCLYAVSAIVAQRSPQKIQQVGAYLLPIILILAALALTVAQIVK